MDLAIAAKRKLLSSGLCMAAGRVHWSLVTALHNLREPHTSVTLARIVRFTLASQADTISSVCTVQAYSP